MKKIETRKYQITHEVWNSITHGLATILAVLALLFLLFKGIHDDSVMEIVAFSIYGGSLFFLFLFSTLAHSLHFTRAQKVFQVFDHNGIFLLIAGSYTPYCLITIGGWLGWILAIVIWICAITGISLTSVFLPRTNHVPRFSTILYVVLGWAILFVIYPLWQSLNHTGFWLLVAGGIVYSLGAIIYRYKFPYAHVVWHLFVMLAAGLMFFSIYGFVGK